MIPEQRAKTLLSDSAAFCELCERVTQSYPVSSPDVDQFVRAAVRTALRFYAGDDAVWQGHNVTPENVEYSLDLLADHPDSVFMNERLLPVFFEQFNESQGELLKRWWRSEPSRRGYQNGDESMIQQGNNEHEQAIRTGEKDFKKQLRDGVAQELLSIVQDVPKLIENESIKTSVEKHE